jgi:hypothetical protein
MLSFPSTQFQTDQPDQLITLGLFQIHARLFQINSIARSIPVNSLFQGACRMPSYEPISACEGTT